MKDLSDLHAPSFFLLSIVENLGIEILPELQSRQLLLGGVTP